MFIKIFLPNVPCLLSNPVKMPTSLFPTDGLLLHLPAPRHNQFYTTLPLHSLILGWSLPSTVLSTSNDSLQRNPGTKSNVSKGASKLISHILLLGIQNESAN